MTVTPILVICATYIASWTIILGLVGFDPWKNRRLQKYLSRWREAPSITDDVEFFVADTLSHIFLLGTYTDELRCDMKIMDLYYMCRRTSPLDDMEFEHLIMAVEEKYHIRLTEREVLDFDTIRSFAAAIKRKCEQSEVDRCGFAALHAAVGPAADTLRLRAAVR